MRVDKEECIRRISLADAMIKKSMDTWTLDHMQKVRKRFSRILETIEERERALLPQEVSSVAADE